MALTNKQRAFAEAYLANGFNATRAAETAGYSGDANALAVRGSETVRNRKVKDLIDQRIKDMAMSADEALARLSAMGRGDLRAFVGLTAEQLQAHPQGFLLHKVRQRRRVLLGKDGEDTVVEEQNDVEIYDAKDALAMILKEQHLKAGEATERVDVDDSKAQDARDKIERALARLAERTGTPGGAQQPDG